ncbi:MAG: hypothetical protein ABI585_11500 [Betaproteobacteria bacterium]
MVDAATPLRELRYSSDITVSIGSPALTVGPADIIRDFLAGPFTAPDIGSIPEGAQLVAYHRTGSGGQLLVFDTVVTLGGALFGPRDVVHYDGATHTLYFDGAAQGIPDGVRITGIALTDSGQLLLAFDTTVALSGNTYAPIDIARWNGSAFVPYFAGGNAGIGPGLLLQDFHLIEGTSQLLMTFDTSGTVGGVTFDRSDVVEYTPGSPGIWQRAFRATSRSSAWSAADLTALWAAAGAAILVPTLHVALLALLALALATMARRRLRPSTQRPDREPRPDIQR